VLAAAAIAGCMVFPASNPWNQRVDGEPTRPGSDAMVRAIGLDDPVHPDFGTKYGIPFQVVPKAAKKTRVRFQYADESDKGPYPIPSRPKIEGGSDRHLLLVQKGSCRLYELFAAARRSGRWHARSGAIFDLRSNRLRPSGWTSADAAGLPILPGLARYDEVKSGAIDHALRFTVPRTRKSFIYPARHFASSSDDPSLPAMGQRFRLKKSFDTSRYPRQARIVLEALKRYGMILADNGSSWFISGAPARGWNNDDLHTLGQVTGSDFEAVDTSSLPRP